MAYQAKQREDAGDEEAKQAFEAAMSNDYTAGQEVAKFAERNPPDQKYARKSFIDWTAFKEVHGKKITYTDRNKTKPMWRGEFILWATRKKALTQIEAEDWWAELEKDPKIERDNGGYKGRLQLWIPNITYKLLDKSNYIDRQHEQGNKPINKAKDSDINMLRAHLKRQRMDACDEFLHIGMASGSAGPDCPGDQPPAKRAKTVDLGREVPKLARTMTKDLAAVRKAFETAEVKYNNASKALSDASLEVIQEDTALFSLLRSVDWAGGRETQLRKRVCMRRWRATTV